MIKLLKFSSRKTLEGSEENVSEQTDVGNEEKHIR